MVTTRHSDNALSASEAATASINRWDATGALWPLKPVAPGNRIMAVNPYTRANHPLTEANFSEVAGKIAAAVAAKMA